MRQIPGAENGPRRRALPWEFLCDDNLVQNEPRRELVKWGASSVVNGFEDRRREYKCEGRCRGEGVVSNPDTRTLVVWPWWCLLQIDIMLATDVVFVVVQVLLDLSRICGGTGVA